MALDKIYLRVHSGIRAERIYAHLNDDLLKLHNLQIIFERKKKIVPKKFITSS